MVGVADIIWGVPGTAYCWAISGKGGSGDRRKRPQSKGMRRFRSYISKEMEWKFVSGSLRFAMLADW